MSPIVGSPVFKFLIIIVLRSRIFKNLYSKNFLNLKFKKLELYKFFVRIPQKKSSMKWFMENYSAFSVTSITSLNLRPWKIITFHDPTKGCPSCIQKDFTIVPILSVINSVSSISTDRQKDSNKKRIINIQIKNFYHVQ